MKLVVVTGFPGSGKTTLLLSSDLVTTLRQAAEVLAPSLVFLEPSGVARADQLVTVVRTYAKEVSEIKVIGLLDPTRREFWVDEVPPFVAAAIKYADLALVNKSDVASKKDYAWSLSAWANALPDGGCRLIGHIKALAQGVPQGHLYASLVSLEQGVSLRGELSPCLREARLTFNLIVYGVEQARLPGLLEGCVLKRFPSAVRTGGQA